MISSFFKIKDQEALKKILGGGPYKCGIFIISKRQSLCMKLDKLISLHSSVDNLYNVPLKLCTAYGLSLVASDVYLDPPTQNKSGLAYGDSS